MFIAALFIIIKNEKDPKKKAELEKKYNEKYAELLEGSGKLDDSVLDRIKDKERTDRYYELKAEYDAIKEKLKKEDPNSEENKKSPIHIELLLKSLKNYKKQPLPRKGLLIFYLTASCKTSPKRLIPSSILSSGMQL